MSNSLKIASWNINRVRARLVQWVLADRRSFDKVEEIWSLYRQLSGPARYEVKQLLGEMAPDEPARTGHQRRRVGQLGALGGRDGRILDRPVGRPAARAGSR